MQKLIKFLENKNIEYYNDFEICSISSIKLGKTLPLAIFPKNKNELEKILVKLSKSNYKYKVIGNSSNIIFLKSPNYPVVLTCKMVDEICIKNCEVSVSAGVMLSKLSEVLKKNNLSGFEGLANIPATVGGAIFCGAGAFGYNIFDKLVLVEVFDGKSIFVLTKNEIKFAHHYSNLKGLILISAKFLFEKKNEYDIIKLLNKYSYLRNATQPVGFSLGSIFDKVGEMSAGFYIERSGLKGKRFGGIFISNKHANFVMNDGSGTIEDFYRMVRFIKSEVEKNFGICLTTEIEQVGDEDENFGRLSYSLK